ncbi:MAG: hypothetical protein RLP02_19945 [Coleofasciculus sp. C2-GNP5-27]
MSSPENSEVFPPYIVTDIEVRSRIFSHQLITNNLSYIEIWHE